MSIQDIARSILKWADQFTSPDRSKKAERVKSVAILQQDENWLGHRCTSISDACFLAYMNAKTSAKEIYNEVIQDLPDMSPLPANFNYSYALTSYFWLSLIMTSKMLGHRAARFSIVYTALEAVFNRWVAAFILYVQLPLYTILINKKISERILDRHMRRAVIIVLAFFYGLLGEFIWLHWLHASVTAPHYYYPVIISAVLQTMGPHLGSNRCVLLAVCVGAAVSASLGIAAYNDMLTVYHVIATFVSAMSSLLNLQLLIGDLRRRGADELIMISGHYRATIVSSFGHGILTLFCAHYDKMKINEADTAID